MNGLNETRGPDELGRNERQDEEGVFYALVEEMEERHLPRALDIQIKLAQGGELDDLDIVFLEHVFNDAERLKPGLAQHPEYEALAARMSSLYLDITTRALAEAADDAPDPVESGRGLAG